MLGLVFSRNRCIGGSIDLLQRLATGTCDTIMPPKNLPPDPDRNLQLRGDTYYVRYKLGGATHRESLGTSDIKAARKARDRILTKVIDRRDGVPQPVVHTWQQAVDGALAHMRGQARAGELAESAVARYETSIVQVSLALGMTGADDDAPIPLDTVTRRTVADFVDARRDEERATSTVLNDLTAWSRVMSYAVAREMIESNPVREIDRRELVGRRRQEVNPPTDPEVAMLAEIVAEWSPDMSLLIRWLRETGMRLAESLQLRAEDIHPCGMRATLKKGVKRNRGSEGGVMTRTIHLGRAARFLADMPKRGRLFARLHPDSAVTSTRYGQWCRQRQGREDRAAKAEGRDPVRLDRYRLHSERHAFAVASLVDDPDCIYRLSAHLGHTKVATTEIYTEHLKKDGAMWHYSRRPDLFGGLPTEPAIPPRDIGGVPQGVTVSH